MKQKIKEHLEYCILRLNTLIAYGTKSDDLKELQTHLKDINLLINTETPMHRTVEEIADIIYDELSNQVCLNICEKKTLKINDKKYQIVIKEL